MCGLSVYWLWRLHSGVKHAGYDCTRHVSVTFTLVCGGMFCVRHQARTNPACVRTPSMCDGAYICAADVSSSGQLSLIQSQALRVDNRS